MDTKQQQEPGTLYITATPIGNLEDITLRALRILKEVDVIAAEDTRHTRKLLTHFEITTPLISYYREREQERSVQLVNRIIAGESVALVSDAGTPGISDPGAVLVTLAHKRGLNIVPVPGPSALATALSVSGVTDSSFLFLGFAPSKKSQRKTLLTSLSDHPHPIVFYESPRRIQSLLTDILQIMGDRNGFWARELTKTHEDLQVGTIRELLDVASSRNNRGEFVLIVHPGKLIKAEGNNVEELLTWYRDNTSLTLKDVSRKIASDLGLSRSAVYQNALIIYKKKL
jgi:16S rRNA (cytidine1402-2'-O)-methyltransferase